MIATRGLGAGYGALPSFGLGAGFSAPAPAATGSKGRRLVRWLIDIPPARNPLGEYIWRREEDEIFILF